MINVHRVTRKRWRDLLLPLAKKKKKKNERACKKHDGQHSEALKTIEFQRYFITSQAMTIKKYPRQTRKRVGRELFHSLP